MKSSADVRADLRSPISTLAALLRREGLSEPAIEQALAELFGIIEEGPRRELRRVLASARFVEELRRELMDPETSETERPRKIGFDGSERTAEWLKPFEVRERPVPVAKRYVSHRRGTAADALPRWSDGKTTDWVRIVQDFLGAVSQATATADVGTLLERATGALGFDYYVIVHPAYARQGISQALLTNAPSVWIDSPADAVWGNPLMRHAERTCSAFRWADLHKLLDLTSDEEGFLRQMARQGIVQGISVPQHVPGETIGSCHFLVQGKRAFPEASVAAVQAIGAFAFEAVRRLAAAEAARHTLDSEPLSQRQRECLVWVARGKSDSVIAQLLSIKPRTVSEHIEAAKRRYSVATRSQLLVRALFRSEVQFAEVLDSPPESRDPASTGSSEKWEDRARREEPSVTSPQSNLERLAVSLAGGAKVDAWLAQVPAEGYATDD